MSGAASVKLTVRVDHIAGIRQMGLSGQPDILAVATAAADGGADGLSARVYHDRRAIQDHDAETLVRESRLPVTLIASMREGLLDLVLRCGPAACCLAPESREDFTVGGGLDVLAAREPLARAAERLLETAIRPVAFIDPDRVQVEACADCGIREICLNTGAYSFASAPAALARQLSAIATAAAHAARLGLRVRAGSGLDYGNAAAIAAVEHLAEIEVGHAIVAAAVTTGISSAVLRLKSLINGARAA